MNRDRVSAMLRDFAGKRILVIGDLMLDEIPLGKSLPHFSPEAPVLRGRGGEGRMALGVLPTSRAISRSFRRTCASWA